MQEEAREGVGLVNKSSKVRLQKREYEVLSELERWGLLGLGQLEGLLFWTGSGTLERWWKYYWNEYDRGVFDRYVYKRLLRLEKAGYIRRFHQVGEAQGEFLWAYGLTERGKAGLEAAGLSLGLGVRRSWSWRMIPGYIRINSVGLLLSKAMGLGVKSRHQLACESRVPGLRESQVQSRTPDLSIEGKTPLAVFVGGAQTWAAELKRWRRTQGQTLLYLTESRKELLLRRAAKEGAGHVYAADLKQFRWQLGATVFTNSADETATLDELIGRTGSPQAA